MVSEIIVENSTFTTYKSIHIFLLHPHLSTTSAHTASTSTYTCLHPHTAVCTRIHLSVSAYTCLHPRTPDCTRIHLSASAYTCLHPRTPDQRSTRQNCAPSTLPSTVTYAASRWEGTKCVNIVTFYGAVTIIITIHYFSPKLSFFSSLCMCDLYLPFSFIL